MATLTRTRASTTSGLVSANHTPDVENGIPKPFPTRAEREQAEILESLGLEELKLEEHGESSLQSLPPPPPTAVTTTSLEDTRKPKNELLPSINNLQSACLTALNDLLSTSLLNHEEDEYEEAEGTFPTPSGSTSTNHQAQLLGAAEDSNLIRKLRQQVDQLAPSLSSRDAELAHALIALLTHFHTLSTSNSATTATSSHTSLAASSSHQTHAHLQEGSSSSPSPPNASPISHLRRQVNDFQQERLTFSEAGLMGESPTPMRAVQSVLLWSQIDDQLETVLSLCRTSTDETNSLYLPPQYGPEDYERSYGGEGLPEYEVGDYALLDARSKSGAAGAGTTGGEKNSGAVSPTMSHASVSEKMKMDLESVTRAIDRLYEVAPQLHNQRVELKKAKVEQLERASREGKKKQVEKSPDERELDKVLDMIGKAVERKMSDQSVVYDDVTMRARVQKVREREEDKRTAFVEQLIRHSTTGRFDSQDATFSPTSTIRPTRTEDPHTLLTLPEFIREAIPEAVSKRMKEEELDLEAMLTLPEFAKESIPEILARPLRHSRFQSVSLSNETTDSLPAMIGASSSPGSTSKSAKATKTSRTRSLSAPPLAWLLSGSSSRSASPAKLSKLASRPSSSHAHLPSQEIGLDVTYVAEHHENLQHVLVFLTVSGVKAGVNVEAEVVEGETSDDRPRLLLRCGTITSPLLDLPARVAPGKKDIKVAGEYHYEVKLHTPLVRSHSQPDTSSSSIPADVDPPAIMDATHLTSSMPTSFICTSCSLPLLRASKVTSYRDLPSEHWAELVDAWMCHSDLKLHEHVQKSSKDGFWPRESEALVGGSYLLVREPMVVKENLCDPPRQDDKEGQHDDWTRVRCICGAVVGRCQLHSAEDEGPACVYRFTKYAFRPVSPTANPVKVPLSAFIVEDMNEYIQAHATYRFVVVDEEEDRPRILIWLFKPNMRLSYTIPSQYAIPKAGSIRAAKILFKLLGPSNSPTDLSSILNKYPGFPQAEHLYYPIDICRRIAAVLNDSNKAYPESMRTMTGLDVGWLQRM